MAAVSSKQPQRVRRCTCIRLGPAVPRCAATHTLPTREPMRIDHTAKKGLKCINPSIKPLFDQEIRMRRPPPWKAGKQGRGFGRKGERERRLRQRGYGRRVAGCGLQAAGGGWQAAGRRAAGGGRRRRPGGVAGKPPGDGAAGVSLFPRHSGEKRAGRPWQTTSAGFAAARRGSLRAGRQRETPAARLADGVASSSAVLHLGQRIFASGSFDPHFPQFTHG